MTRDFSAFLPNAKTNTPPKHEATPLERLGWKPFFNQQIDPDEHANLLPVRVVEVHRSGLRVLGDGVDAVIPPGLSATVGDWVLYNPLQPPISIVLERATVVERRAPGKEVKRQLIAANVDTIFIVSSCNDEFNVARLERYVSLAFEADVIPVIVLTKPDLCEDVAPYVDAAVDISDRLTVETLNALTDAAIDKLSPWCKPGQTVAFLGSSGVGKSTLVNALFNETVAETGAIRSDDSKGRHTTSHRQLHFTPSGCAILDTPGMRELQLTGVEAGIADVFADLTELATGCRFRNCGHDTEPGCAVQAAVAKGEIDATRLARWAKLSAEEKFNTSSLSERKAGDKSLHKRIKAIQKKSRKS